MTGLRTKREVLGILGVVVAIAAGATLPIVLSAAAGAHGAAKKQPPVAACSPPAGAANQPVANFSPPCTPAVSVKPNTGLGDGQTVKVVGTGFSANAPIAVIECRVGAVNASGCDLSTLFELQSSNVGSFTTTYNVTRIIDIPKKHGGAKTLDCAKVACLLGASDITNYTVSASSSLSFNPRLPLELTATLSHKGTTNAKKGSADISGTVSCTRPLTVDIQVELTQIYGRFVFRSEGQTVLSCKGTKTWTVRVPPGNGTYAPGVATATANIEAETGTSYREIELSGKIHLKAATKK